ncbi:tropomyosin [Lepeophtheirus salmonis]|uniref:Tropomyosin 1 [Drosophila melanogaster] n=1 Tax=Lepeophtheirus salmonis TaxID=72036 RepID=A0A0K2T868_LEPSM|nr:tropomyosin-2-like [Lepeophtheirus salmonis]
MDIIRRKVFNLHFEKDSAVSECVKQEKDVEGSINRAKAAESLARDLAKKVGKLENDLDEKSDALTLSSKKYIEKDKALYDAKKDGDVLTKSITDYEERLHRADEEFESISNTVNVVSAKADEFEKKRKELEHNNSLHEDQIGKLEFDIRDARFLEEDAMNRAGEVEKKTDFVKHKLERTLSKADSDAEKIVILEEEFKVFGKKMIEGEAFRERAGKRAEVLKKNIMHLNLQLVEANKRADCEEVDVEKLEFRIKHINLELERFKSQTGNVKKELMSKK